MILSQQNDIQYRIIFIGLSKHSENVAIRLSIKQNSLNLEYVYIAAKYTKGEFAFSKRFYRGGNKMSYKVGF